MTTTYLGMRRRTAAALAVAAVAAGVALGIALEPPHPCGTVAEDHVTAPAYCGDPAELHARLEVIRAERTGGRFADPQAAADLARCAETNGAPLTVDACRTYLAEVAAVAAACPMPDQAAFERCAAEVTR